MDAISASDKYTKHMDIQQMKLIQMSPAVPPSVRPMVTISSPASHDVTRIMVKPNIESVEKSLCSTQVEQVRTISFHIAIAASRTLSS